MSDQSDRPAWSDISARLQNLRNLLSSERHLGAEQQRAFEALDREIGDQMAELGAAEQEPGHQVMGERSATRDRRRRDLEAHLQERDAPSVSGGLPQASSPSSLVRSRRRAFRPSERLQRYQRERLAQSGRGTASETHISPPHVSPARQEQSAGDRGDRQRAKRRKLDDGTYEEEPRTFSYGDKGQVVPGGLKLDIISCDGGEYPDPHTPINSYPQNVLQDDTTVYCTKSNRCNLLLKHIGGMPFTLTKIVVKAPRSGYDAPIQEGLVFVAMEDDALLDRTSQYDISWSPKYRHERRAGDRYRPSHEYMNSARSPLRSIDRSRYLTSPTYLEDDPLLETHLVPGFQVTVADPSDEEEVADSPPSPRPWHDDEYSLRSYVDRYRPVYLGDEGNNGRPWTNSSDSEGSERDIPRETRGPSERERFHRQQRDLENTLAHRNRMLDLMRAQQIRESDEFFGRQGRDHDQELSYLRRPAYSGTGSRAAALTSGVVDPARPPDDQSSMSTSFETPASKTILNRAEPSSSAKVDVVVPHARFFISRSKSSTAIKFDPPVSGRYILVKLWAQCPNANIDIQAILAHGYGGPRFFPALEMR